MKARRLIGHAVAALLAAALFAATATSALAAPPVLPTVSAGPKTFAAPASLLTTTSVVDTAAVKAWVANTVAKGVDRKAANATMSVNKKKKRIDFKASVIGYKVNQSDDALKPLLAALASATESSTPSTIALTTAVTKPKITKFGRTLLVVLSQRKIYLYDNMKVYKTFRCAIGQKAWPTPTGNFYIGKKNPRPTWTNGYASWSRNMPAFIGPGPNNPLGTRALYVYNSKGKDTGVRFHGVPHSEDPSIGHAASHGCLRMHRKDVEKLYPLVPLKTKVYIIK
jgi:lipoprotein-anchoring transpeptidase ErfK/SrfK